MSTAHAITVSVLFFNQGLTDEQKEKLRSHGRLCITETGVDKELVQKVRDGDYTSNDDKLKDFALCMLKKIELVDKDGKFNKEVAVSKVAEEDKVKVGEAIDKCLAPDTVVTADIAWGYSKCYHAARPDHAIF